MPNPGLLCYAIRCIAYQECYLTMVTFSRMTCGFDVSTVYFFNTPGPQELLPNPITAASMCKSMATDGFNS